MQVKNKAEVEHQELNYWQVSSTLQYYFYAVFNTLFFLCKYGIEISAT